MAFDLITIGDATVDTFLILDKDNTSCELKKGSNQLCLNYAEKICINATEQSIGGGAANIAVGAARLDVKSAIVTEVGDDINGHVIIHELEERGVDISHTKMLKDKQTRYSIILNYAGERTILATYVSREYTLPKLPKTKWIYYTSLGHSFAAMQKELIDHLEEHPDTKLAFTPGSYQLKNGVSTIKKILPKVNMLFVNKEEAGILLEEAGDITTCLKKLQALGVETPIITNGKEGAYLLTDKGEVWHMPIYPVEVHAKTGAGDAFASGAISAIIHGKNQKMSLQWGTANSANVIQKFGAQKGLATVEKITETINKFSQIIPQKIA